MTPYERLTEQEARVALKEHYRSQEQNHRTAMLTLVIGFFTGMEVLRILDLPWLRFVFWFCVASGFLGLGVHSVVVLASKDSLHLLGLWRLVRLLAANDSSPTLNVEPRPQPAQNRTPCPFLGLIFFRQLRALARTGDVRGEPPAPLTMCKR